MSKALLRNTMLKTMKELSSEERARIEESLTARLVESELWENAQIIGLTLSKFPEWNTKAIIEHAWKDGKKVAIPKTISKTKQMHFYVFQSYDEVEQSAYGIEEPIPETTARIDANQMDCLIVPGVLFTEKGYRIGFGGGYYDRFLQHYDNRTLSLCSEKQLGNQFEVEPHDIPVQTILTENRSIDCTRK